ncbi:protein phosphatase 2C domain-containing protein [Kitasatospora sp. NPDC001540]|uniref:protein phosphatase 2C domain-containing protein n=1 Tax=Kitasatospora sp. NPDC001540 TaxID=3364014 RepID=UPI0036B7A9F7
MHVITGELPGGSRPSEDRVLVSDDRDLVVVLDDVSTLSDDTPRGGWYAQTLGEEILTAHRRTPRLDLRDTLHEALTAVSGTHALTPGASPAATVAIVRHRPDDRMVDALVLCDTIVLAQQHDGSVEALRDDRLEDLVRPHPDMERLREHLRAGHGFSSPAHREMLGRLRQHQLQHINRHGDPYAYWVAEAVPAAARHAVVRSWPQAQLRRVLVATDGVQAGVESYGLWAWGPLVEACADTGFGPQRAVERIQAYEHTDDPDGVKHPRYKISDDKAVALLSFDPHR